MSFDRRKMGTGSVCKCNGRWYAYGPGRHRKLLGSFEHRIDAVRFLDAWVKAQAVGVAA